MLQIKSIQINDGFVPCNGENIQFNFMGSNWKDFHLMQDIIRKFVTEHFGKKCTFGYIINGNGKIIRETSAVKYPKNTPFTIIVTPNEKQECWDYYNYITITWLKTWPTGPGKVVIKKRERNESAGDK